MVRVARRLLLWQRERERECAAPLQVSATQLPAAAAAQVACERTRTALNRDAIITATQVPFNSCIYYAGRGWRDECVCV
jgi:hypothetical protein